MDIDLSGAPDLLEGEDYIPEPANDLLAGAPDLLAGETLEDAEKRTESEFQSWGDIGKNFMLSLGVGGGMQPRKDLVKGLGEKVTGAEFETEETRSLPEVGQMSSGSAGKDLKMAAGLLAALEEDDKKEVIQSNLPDATFREDEKGNTIVEYQGKAFVLNKPGMSFQDGIQSVYQLLSFVPAMKLQTLGKGLAQKIGIGFTAGAGTSVANDMIADAAGAENAVSPSRAVVAGSIESAFPLGGAAIKSVKGMIAGPGRRAVTESLEEVAREGLKASERTGIDLTKPQVTTNPQSIREQDFIAQLPAGAQKAEKFLKNQNEQAYTAVNQFMDAIAPASSVTTGPTRFRTAAQDAVEAAKDMRQKQGGPLYEQAFQENVKVDISPLISNLDEQIKRYPKGGKIAKELSGFRKMLAAEQDGVQLTKADLDKIEGLTDELKQEYLSTLQRGFEEGQFERLHNIKREIFARSSSKSEKPLDATSKKILNEMYSDLVTTLEGSSESYLKAQQAYREASPEVASVVDSIVGRVAKYEDKDLKGVARAVFDPTETNTQTIKKAREIISARDPGAWDEIMRVEFERRIGSMKAPSNAAIENAPAELRRVIFGNTKDRRALFAGMTDEQKKNAMWLDEALRRASMGRNVGSPTAERSEMLRRLKLVSWFRSFGKAPVDQTFAIGEDVVMDRKVAQLADMIFDPAYTIDMRQLRKYSNPESPGAVKAFTQMLTRMESASAHGEKP